MAQTESADPHWRQAMTADWPELLSKTISDLSEFVRTELELREAGLKRIIEAQIDRAVGMAAVVIVLMYGLLLLLGGVVLLIHLWFDWWLAFSITGTATVASGLA